MPIDINFGALEQANPFAAFTQGQEIGQKRRQMQARQAAGNVFATDPDKAAQILMSTGDYEGGMAMRKAGLEQKQEAARRAVMSQAAGGDLPGAKKAALDANDMDAYNVLASMSKERREQVKAANEDFGSYAQTLLDQVASGKLTVEQAKAHILEDKPLLVQMGIPEAKIDGFIPTPKNLQLQVGLGLDLKAKLEQVDKDRNFGLRQVQANESARHNRAAEGVAAGQLGVARGNLGVRQQEYRARKSAGGFGTPGVPELPPGFVMEK